MARSTYVYVVWLGNTIRPFTVKHEAQSYLNRDLYKGEGAVIKQYYDAGDLVREWSLEKFLNG